MVKSAINQFDITPGNNTDCDGVGVGSSMTVDNTNDAFQHLMALMAQQIGEVGALGADTASASTTDLSAVHGWFANITGTNTIASFGTVPGGKIFHLRMPNGLTLTYNAVSMILPNAINLAVGAGDVVTMLSLGSGNWRLLNSVPAAGSALPPGTIVDFGGTSAPGGWLLCYGQPISRTGYPLLYAALGTTYGAGDGATTFNVPDLRGRVTAGKDDMGGSSAARLNTIASTTLGTAGGAQTHTLTTAELPSHLHTFSDSGTTGSDSPNHAHSGNVLNTTGGTNVGTVAAGSGVFIGNTGNVTANHQHSFSVSGNTGTAGSGSAHNNIQPTTITNKIIKT